MLSSLPVNLEGVEPNQIDQEILRVGIIAELDAVSFYEQMSAKTQNPKLKAVLADIAKEEKTHVGEFQALLLEMDEEQKQELDAGKKEVAEI